MKILKVIHGYPLRFNAGSEVYSQTLCRGLAKDHEVEVFTRAENPFIPDYVLQREKDLNIGLNVINLPLEKHRYRYSHSEVDSQFEQVLERFQPDVVHIGHLNHLSLTLVDRIPHSIPIIYTLHDYWLICPRGQFIQRLPRDLREVWALCKNQKDEKCAIHCYSGYFSGVKKDWNKDLIYWSNWIKRRRECIEQVMERVNYFICPSQYLLTRFRNDLNIPKEKLIYLDYGFDLNRLQGRKRKEGERFTFGYIGTHIPAKGIQLLISAFSELKGECELKIWGRTREHNTKALKEIIEELPKQVRDRIKWIAEYDNQHIVKEVFNYVDAIVVPSIWVENSPLVIHEALQVRVPVITAEVGGMSEYIYHKENGLLFKHRDIKDLRVQMQEFINNPQLVDAISERGYLFSKTRDIPSIESHVEAIEKIYLHAIQESGKKKKEEENYGE